MCMTATSEQDRRCPGTQALTLIGDHLADNKYEVSSPEWDGTHLLRVMNAPLALCDLTINDSAAQWYYQPFLGHQGTAGDAVAMVTAILGTGNPAFDGATSASLPVPPGNPHLAEVRNALARSGLPVTSSYLGDLGQLEVNSPSRLDRGAVWITSDHAVIWDCQRASVGGRVGFDFAMIAGTITRALAAASQ